MIATLNRGWLGALGLCLALAAQAQAQDQPGDFATQVPLTLSGDGPWYRLELPLAVQMLARHSDLADVRVFNAAGEPMAYAVAREPAQTHEQRNLHEVKWFPLYSAADAAEAKPSVRVQSNASGTLVQVEPSTELEAGEEVLRGWLLDTSAVKAPLEQLILDWTDRDGFQRFSIEASDDLQRWRAWGEGQVARLSFADERVEQHEVSLPGQPACYLRLLWNAPQAAPALTSVQVRSTSSTRLPQPLVWSQRLTGSSVKDGEYTWQLPVALNVERLRLEMGEANTLAPVLLYGRRDSSAPWYSLGGGLLYRLSQNGQDVVQDQLQLPGQVVQQLKLAVDGRGGGLGLAAPALYVAVRPSQVVFLARGAGPYTLALGSPTAKAASLGLETLIPDYRPERLATLGQARVDASVPVASAPVAGPLTEPLPIVAGTDWKKLSLWAVLLLGVLALAGMAFSLLRKQ